VTARQAARRFDANIVLTEIYCFDGGERESQIFSRIIDIKNSMEYIECANRHFLTVIKKKPIDMRTTKTNDSIFQFAAARVVLFRIPGDNGPHARHEKRWLTYERYHVLVIDPKYPPGNYSRLKRTPSQLSPPLLAPTPSPSLPLSSHRNSRRHRRRYRSCFWHRGNTPATYEYLRRLNMHTTDNVLFLLDGRSIYYRATHTHIYVQKYNGSACVHRVFEFYRINR